MEIAMVIDYKFNDFPFQITYKAQIVKNASLLKSKLLAIAQFIEICSNHTTVEIKMDSQQAINKIKNTNPSHPKLTV